MGQVTNESAGKQNRLAVPSDKSAIQALANPPKSERGSSRTVGAASVSLGPRGGGQRATRVCCLEDPGGPFRKV